MKRRTKRSVVLLRGDALWYKDAIIYEVPVRAFHDSNGDGVGDFKGLIEKLDYLQDLGVTALWLLPFYPSPLRDDGYDIADYRDVHPHYGTLADFKLFLREAHRRGLRVITELVINHTSDRHPWFQRARHAPPGHPHRDFYVWSDTDTRYREARIIFKDFETSNWTRDPIANAYYWHRFYSHQPDLNYCNPAVQVAVIDILDYWLDMGIDGFRLDAIPYLYEREGTNCENLPETHAFLKKLRKHVDDNYPDRMLLAEANQWPEDAVAYFGGGAGDECHMAFHFPVMPRLFMAVRMEDRLPIFDILQQTPPIPHTSQWAMFLRNHDELTLEMVTDEDRDYMYRVYARDPRARINLGIRRRLAPLLENHRAQIELMNALLFSLPGTPVLYYGDEIGMGDNIYLGDRNGVRTPMQWSSGRNGGFSRANPQSLYLPLIIDPEYHYEAINVEVQQSNPHSLLWWTKRLIDLRNRHKAFGRGDLQFLTPENHKVLAFLRSYSAPRSDVEGPPVQVLLNGDLSRKEHPDHFGESEDTVLVVANLSRFPQFVELDLSKYAGRSPLELMGRSKFPVFGEKPYALTLGPYAFYWFEIERAKLTAPIATDSATIPEIEVFERWENIFRGGPKQTLQNWLPNYLRTRTWFAGINRQVEAAMILETVPILVSDGSAHIALVQVEYSEGDAETYVLPIAFTGETEGRFVREEKSRQVVARVRLTRSDSASETGVLYDPVEDSAFDCVLLDAILRHRRFKRGGGEIRAINYSRSHQPSPPTIKIDSGPQPAKHDGSAEAAPALFRGKQRHSSIVFRDRYVLKLYRRIEEGLHPEVEAGLFLTEKAHFQHCARIAGSLEYRRGWGEPMTIGVLHEYLPHQEDGWRYCRDALDLYFDRARVRPERPADLPVPRTPSAVLGGLVVPSLDHEMIGPALEAMRALGNCVAELHLALASQDDDPAFAPEPFSTLYQRSLYQSLRSQIRRTFMALRRRLDVFPDASRRDVNRLLTSEDTLLSRVRKICDGPISCQRVRIHGGLDLREVLYDGRDFSVIDFEGDLARPLSARRRKYSPLRDVASMLRSFHYAACLALDDGTVRREDRPNLEPWAQLWRAWASGAFLGAYFDVALRGKFLPARAEERDTLLDFYLVKRAVAELETELARVPTATDNDRVRALIPIEGLLEFLDEPE